MKQPAVGTLARPYLSRFKSPSSLAVTLLIGLLAPAVGLGQAFMASLSGVVTDATGAVIPGVTIELKNSATGDVRETVSADNGTYHLSQLLTLLANS